MSPRGDRPIAVEYPGYPVITLRPIEGIEFVEEAVAAVGSSGESPPTCSCNVSPSALAV